MDQQLHTIVAEAETSLLLEVERLCWLAAGKKKNLAVSEIHGRKYGEVGFDYCFVSKETLPLGRRWTVYKCADASV